MDKHKLVECGIMAKCVGCNQQVSTYLLITTYTLSNQVKNVECITGKIGSSIYIVCLYHKHKLIEYSVVCS